MTWGFFDKAIAYETMSSPPTSTAHRKPMSDPRASNCSAIWMQSSLVGDITHAKNGYGLSNKAYITGIANAAVLPDPVSASPIISRPLSVYGRDSAWILVGFLYPKFVQAWEISAQTPSFKNVVSSTTYLIASSSFSPSNETASASFLSSSFLASLIKSFSSAFVLCLAASALTLSMLDNL
jgi:hypothetical protein